MSTSVIEDEHVHSRYCSTIHGAYIDEYSLGNTFSFENANPTISFPNTSIQGHEDALLSNIDDIEQLLQLQTHLIDFDLILQQDPITGPAENVAGDETMTFSSGTKAHSLIELEKSYLKTIQDEVMEESSLTDLLLMGAEAVEADNMDLASTVVAGLHNLLSTSKFIDNPLDRLAPFFTQALHDKICVNALDLSIEEDFKYWKTNYSGCVSTTAFQMLQELSPYVKFGHFTANQAILEATQGNREIHVIDFDILEGMQWPPFMIDLAVRENVSLKITAIVLQVGNQQQNSEVSNIQQTARRLQEFSESINLDFIFDQILIRREGDFSGIQVNRSSTLVANCMVHQLHHQTDCRFLQLVKTFLKGVTKLSPKIIILVEDELFNFSNKNPSITFVEFFCEAIHHYTALFDSLASGFSCTGGYNLALRVIEKDFLGMRILDSLRQFPCQDKERKTSWGADEDDGEGYCSILKGFRRMSMSSYNICQANFLVSLFGGGYWVQHEHCRMALCWKSRPLTTASIWVPISSLEEVAVRSTCF